MNQLEFSSATEFNPFEVQMTPTITSTPRHDWTRTQVEALFDISFPELMFRAGTVHRANFDADEISALAAIIRKDRRLRGELRILQPICSLRDRIESVAIDERQRGNCDCCPSKG